MRARSMARRLRRSVSDERVVAAMAAVPRERFVPAELRGRAYDNVALPIAGGQTISQPIVVARMLEALALSGSETVLDVGTGSGYHAALLGRLAATVHSIERDPALSRAAAGTLEALGVHNVHCTVADGWDGLPAHAPYDAINVAAAVPELPGALVAQLAPRGRMIAPVGGAEQRLWLYTAAGARRELEPVRFVPLVRSDPG